MHDQVFTILRSRLTVQIERKPPFQQIFGAKNTSRTHLYVYQDIAGMQILMEHPCIMDLLHAPERMRDIARSQRHLKGSHARMQGCNKADSVILRPAQLACCHQEGDCSALHLQQVLVDSSLQQ